MFVDFFYILKDAGVPVSPTSFLRLQKALATGLVDLVQAAQNLSVSADYWQTLMTPDYDLGWVSAGYTTEDTSQVPLMNAAFGTAPVDVLVVEGTPLTGAPPGGAPGDYCKIGERDGQPVNAYQLLQKLASKGHLRPGSRLMFIIRGRAGWTRERHWSGPCHRRTSKAGVVTKNPVINIPGCPAQPDWVLMTLATVLQGINPDLDEFGRPRAFFGGYVHDNCPRRGAYDRGQFAEVFDDPVGCYWKLGCKGPITLSACSTTKWNGGTGFCTQAGPMCWGCMHPSFPDPPTSAFFAPVEQTPTLFGLTADTVGEAVMGGAAAILTVHAVRRLATKKPEEETEQTDVPAPAAEGGS